MLKFIYSILILFMLVNYLNGQDEMTLPQAISMALENNYNIKIAEKNILIAENNDTWARAGRYPTVDLNGSFVNNFTKDNLSFFLRDPYYAGALGVNAEANWVAYNGGRVRIAKEQFEKNTGVEILNQKTDIHALINDVIQDYYTVLLQQERLGVIQEGLNLSMDQLKYEETKKEFGVSNSFNLIQFENAIVSNSTDLKAQLVQIEIAKRNLYNTLDVLGMTDYEYPEKLSIVPEEIDKQKLKHVLSEENYTLKSLEMIAEISNLNTKLENAARKPTVNLNGSIGISESLQQIFGDNPNTGDRFPFASGSTINASINAFVNWNLYDGGVRKTNIQNAQIQEEIAQLNIIQAKAELENQLDILIANYNNQKDLLQLADQQINIAQRNITLTGERFKSGQITSLDFQNVQNQLLNAAFNKVNAIYNLIITKSQIDFLVGKFDESN